MSKGYKNRNSFKNEFLTSASSSNRKITVTLPGSSDYLPQLPRKTSLNEFTSPIKNSSVSSGSHHSSPSQQPSSAPAPQTQSPLQPKPITNMSPTPRKFKSMIPDDILDQKPTPKTPHTYKVRSMIPEDITDNSKRLSKPLPTPNLASTLPDRGPISQQQSQITPNVYQLPSMAKSDNPSTSQGDAGYSSATANRSSYTNKNDSLGRSDTIMSTSSSFYPDDEIKTNTYTPVGSVPSNLSVPAMRPLDRPAMNLSQRRRKPPPPLPQPVLTSVEDTEKVEVGQAKEIPQSPPLQSHPDDGLNFSPSKLYVPSPNIIRKSLPLTPTISEPKKTNDLRQSLLLTIDNEIQNLTVNTNNGSTTSLDTSALSAGSHYSPLNFKDLRATQLAAYDAEDNEADVHRNLSLASTIGWRPHDDDDDDDDGNINVVKPFEDIAEESNGEFIDHPQSPMGSDHDVGQSSPSAYPTNELLDENPPAVTLKETSGSPTPKVSVTVIDRNTTPSSPMLVSKQSNAISSDSPPDLVNADLLPPHLPGALLNDAGSASSTVSTEDDCFYDVQETLPGMGSQSNGNSTEFEHRTLAPPIGFIPDTLMPGTLPDYALDDESIVNPFENYTDEEGDVPEDSDEDYASNADTYIRGSPEKLPSSKLETPNSLYPQDIIDDSVNDGFSLGKGSNNLRVRNFDWEESSGEEDNTLKDSHKDDVNDDETHSWLNTPSSPINQSYVDRGSSGSPGLMIKVPSLEDNGRTLKLTNAAASDEEEDDDNEVGEDDGKISFTARSPYYTHFDINEQPVHKMMITNLSDDEVDDGNCYFRPLDHDANFEKEEPRKLSVTNVDEPAELLEARNNNELASLPRSVSPVQPFSYDRRESPVVVPLSHSAVIPVAVQPGNKPSLNRRPPPDFASTGRSTRAVSISTAQPELFDKAVMGAERAASPPPIPPLPNSTASKLSSSLTAGTTAANVSNNNALQNPAADPFVEANGDSSPPSGKGVPSVYIYKLRSRPRSSTSYTPQKPSSSRLPIAIRPKGQTASHSRTTSRHSLNSSPSYQTSFSHGNLKPRTRMLASEIDANELPDSKLSHEGWGKTKIPLDPDAEVLEVTEQLRKLTGGLLESKDQEANDGEGLSRYASVRSARGFATGDKSKFKLFIANPDSDDD